MQNYMALELFFSVFFTLALIPLLSLVLLKLLASATRTAKKKTIPGPRKLPLIGNLHHLAHGSPSHLMRELARKHGPLMQLQLGQVSSVVVSSAETAEKILKTHDPKFASRPRSIATKALLYDNIGIIFAPYGESWRQHRRICTVELLSARRVQTFRKIREEECSSLVKWLASHAGSSINLTAKMASSAFSLISRAAVGGRTEEQEEFISATKEISKLTEGFSMAELYPSCKLLQYVSGMKWKLDAVRLRVDGIMENIVQGRRARKSIREEEAHEDLLDVLLKLQVEEAELSFTSIKAILLEILSAGAETTATTLDWAMSEMLKNPSVLREAQAELRRVFSDDTGGVDEARLHELEYLNTVIKETLRLHPPFPLIFRECRESCEVDGYEISAKTSVILNVLSILRDPSYWEEPERFKPERFLDISVDYRGSNFKYIPFGAGRRICPGISFSLASLEHTLAVILYHFDLYLPNGMRHDELDMTPKPGLSMSRKHDLYVVPVVRKPRNSLE